MARSLFITLLSLSLLCIGLGFAWHWQQLNEQANEPTILATSFAYPNPVPVAPFQLTDHLGHPFTDQHLQGTWSLLFIGYTSCPDICPTTLAKLATLYEQLKPQAQLQQTQLQIIFVSVDPQRDTIGRLANYVDFFHPQFIGVTGEHQQLLPFTRQLGMVYAMTGEGENYTVDHSASMVLINPQGKQVAIIKPQVPNLSDSNLATLPALPQINFQALNQDIQQLLQL